MFYPADFKSRFVSDPFFLSVLNMIDIFFVVTSLKVDLIQSLNFKKKKLGNKKNVIFRIFYQMRETDTIQ